MHISNWLIFCGIALLTSFTPGPAVLLAISNSLAVGPRRAMIGSLGNAIGLFVVSAVAMAGMGAVLATSATAFMGLKIAGALYLIYLGIKQLRSKSSTLANVKVATTATSVHAAPRLFSHGLTVALTNPKAILFFTALFPQFLVHDAAIVGQFFVLTATFVACAFLSHTFYVLLARLLKKQFANPQRLRLFNYVSGGMFVVLGLSLLRLRNKAA
ncbi:LysE family translocator [Glaciimonas soli]|uniref:LysE family translocator n=1 Tax=Glaciimonas soli TaxID=2590999 RepID=A0A843YS56_9BURK|nr:LysE family translocator [Glaciimonas soli]MQR00827.1 LysE family translocator [Glaciimonas soli]